MIADLIKELRRKHGYTLQAFSVRSGLSLSYLSDLEHGRTQGSLEALKMIADGFGLKLVIRFEDDNGEDVAESIQREKAEAYDRLKDTLPKIFAFMENYK